MRLTKVMLVFVLVLVCTQACAMKAKPVFTDHSFTFKKTPAISLVVYIRTMGGRSEDQAVINLGWIHGNQTAYTQIKCHDSNKNLEVWLSPQLGYVDGHVEYSDGYYHVDLSLGIADGKKLLPPQKPLDIDFILPDLRRARMIMETGPKVFDTWYITSLATVKKLDPNYPPKLAKMMECFTVDRETKK